MIIIGRNIKKTYNFDFDESCLKRIVPHFVKILKQQQQLVDR